MEELGFDLDIGIGKNGVTISSGNGASGDCGCNGASNSAGTDMAMMDQLQEYAYMALDELDPRGHGYVGGGLRVAAIAVGLYAGYRVVRAAVR